MKTAQKTYLEQRRSFLTRMASFLGITAIGSALSSVLGCETDVLKSSDIAVRFDIRTEPALAQVGGAAKKTFSAHNGGRPVIIIRTGAEAFLVLSSVCTHQACEVDLPGVWDPNLLCPCHESIFSKTDGAVLQGPAAAPLPRFDSRFDTGTQTLTITF